MASLKRMPPPPYYFFKKLFTLVLKGLPKWSYLIRFISTLVASLKLVANLATRWQLYWFQIGYQVAPRALLVSFATRRRHLNWFHISQVTKHALVANSVTRWRHMHYLKIWSLSLSCCPGLPYWYWFHQLVSSWARVTSIKSQQQDLVSDIQTHKRNLPEENFQILIYDCFLLSNHE